VTRDFFDLFENVLDRLTGSDPAITDYVLEAPARCYSAVRRLTKRRSSIRPDALLHHSHVHGRVSDESSEHQQLPGI